MPTASRSRAADRLRNLIGLQTPASRLFVLGGGSLLLALISYGTLVSIPTISLYDRLGIPAPSIGLTRAYSQLLHGNLQAAWQTNPLVVAAAAAIAGIMITDIRQFWRSR